MPIFLCGFTKIIMRQLTEKQSLRLIFLFLLFSLATCKPSGGEEKKPVGLAEIREEFELRAAKEEGDFALAFRLLDQTNRQLLINADERFHAASTMKTPVMIELFAQAGEGKFALTDSVIVRNEFKSIVDSSFYSMDIAVDSGEKLYELIGKKSIYDSLCRDMIVYSSNLATNLLIEIVGAPNVNRRMRSLGADSIDVLRGVEDLKAFDAGLSNSTTARDLLEIFGALADNRAGSAEDCARMIEILSAQHFNDMIPLKLPDSLRIAHKTGAITGVRHDSALIFLPDGRKYVLIFLSKNAGDGAKANQFCADISKMIYDYLTPDSEI